MWPVWVVMVQGAKRSQSQRTQAMDLLGAVAVAVGGVGALFFFDILLISFTLLNKISECEIDNRTE